MMDGGETGQGVAAGKIPLPGLFAEGPICSHQEGWWGVCCRSEERCWRLAPGTLGKSQTRSVIWRKWCHWWVTAFAWTRCSCGRA